MSNLKNRKLCWNCDGSVHIHSTKCPYCGTDLTADIPHSSPAQHTSLNPPYSMNNSALSSGSQIPQPPYSNANSSSTGTSPLSFDPPIEAASLSQATEEQEREQNPASVLTTLLLLIPGAFFLLFSLMLVLFSEKGILTLRWDASYWFFYFLLALPLLVFGWRSLMKRSADED